jgi:hypothetical protein
VKIQCWKCQVVSRLVVVAQDVSLGWVVLLLFWNSVLAHDVLVVGLHVGRFHSLIILALASSRSWFSFIQRSLRSTTSCGSFLVESSWP